MNEEEDKGSWNEIWRMVKGETLTDVCPLEEERTYLLVFAGKALAIKVRVFEVDG